MTDTTEQKKQAEASFKNFHRSLCERFGYYHDEIDWQRDQVSLEEHIATQFNHVNAENAALRGQVEALQRGAGQLQEENEALRLRCDRLEEDKQSMAETHVLYTWLRKKCDQPSNDFVAVQMSVGREWLPVHDLDLCLRAMISREKP
jgi:hypothetical protein